MRRFSVRGWSADVPKTTFPTHAADFSQPCSLRTGFCFPRGSTSHVSRVRRLEGKMRLPCLPKPGRHYHNTAVAGSAYRSVSNTRQIHQTARSSSIHPLCRSNVATQVTVLQEDGLLAEYVHILAGSALVEPGERVAGGQQLCSSGGAGFCPTPHLHLQLQEGESDAAPTVQFALLDCEGNPYFPVAGKWYGSQGEASPQQERLGAADAVADRSSCGGGCVDRTPRVAPDFR